MKSVKAAGEPFETGEDSLESPETACDISLRTNFSRRIAVNRETGVIDHPQR